MKVYIETYGCTMNQGDSDILRGSIGAKYELVESVDKGDVVVINSCGVIDFTEKKILRRIAELKNKNKRVFVTGCLARIHPEKLREITDGVFPIDQTLKLVETIGGNNSFSVQESQDRWRLPKKRLRHSAIAIVPISEGCLGYCSYCAAKIARGRLRSYPAEHIIKEIEECIRDGFKEIQLTAQDTGVYGFDIGSNLPNLLKRISEIDGDFRVRVGMMNPGYTRKIMREMIEAFRSRKIYKFIHVPVQSGDNTVLKDMKRNYSVNDFVELVMAFKRAFSDVVLSTDIIVGYPTETEESFTKSVELVEKIKPDIVNITRFSKREGTEAYALKDLPGWIKKERSRLMTEIHRRIGEDINRQFLGREFEVLITKKGKNGTFLARTDSYRPVVVKSGKIGEFVRVEITDYSPYYLVGELLP